MILVLLGFGKFKRNKGNKKIDEQSHEEPSVHGDKKESDKKVEEKEQPKDNENQKQNSLMFGSSDQDKNKKSDQNNNSNNKPPPNNRNYLPLVILSGIYLFFLIKPSEWNGKYMNYKV